jgi:hypothetical protein
MYIYIRARAHTHTHIHTHTQEAQMLAKSVHSFGAPVLLMCC